MKYYIKDIGNHLFLSIEDSDIPPVPSVAIREIMNQHHLDRAGFAGIAGVPPNLVDRWLAGGAMPTQRALKNIRDYKPNPTQSTLPDQPNQPAYTLDDTLEFVDENGNPTTTAEAVPRIMSQYQLGMESLSAILGCSPHTVRSWVNGQRAPSDTYRERLYHYLYTNTPPPSPTSKGVDINRILLQPNYRMRAKGHDKGHRQLIMYYTRILNARIGKTTQVPLLSVTWSRHRGRSTCTVRTLLDDHPTHDLAQHNGRAEASSDRGALDLALRAAGYRLIDGKRPIGQLIYIGRHLIAPTEESYLTILCHRCVEGRNHPYEVYGGGPVRPSHVPDFM